MSEFMDCRFLTLDGGTAAKYALYIVRPAVAIAPTTIALIAKVVKNPAGAIS